MLSKTDRLNFLNIGLMLFSCVVALFIPFELFLFAYAVLGPAHYLTEISWLQKRQFFTRGEHDYWLLGGLAVLLFVSSPLSSQGFSQQEHTSTVATYTFLALGSALVLILVDRAMPRILGLAAVGALAFVAVNTTGFLIALLALFVPTLVHVYVFTGFFIIYGALKERSRSGYLSFAIFLACPVACWLIHPAKLMPSAYVTVSYFKNFALINMAMLGIDPPQTQGDLLNAARSVFESDTGLIVMRFIAFAYTYHYLNWFSKTSIIRWHQVGKQRLAIVGTLWLASVGIYIYNYALGFKVLFCLSFMHLYLEFPLNHISIIGTFKEVRGRFVRPPAPALAAAARKGS